MRAVTDAQQTRPSERDARGLLPRTSDLIEDLSRVREIGPARGRQRHLVVFAGEHREAELLFQLLNLPAQRRLRHVETFSRAAEMQFLGDGHEIAKMSQLHIVACRPDDALQVS
jgi:hypothetical protein